MTSEIRVNVTTTTIKPQLYDHPYPDTHGKLVQKCAHYHGRVSSPPRLPEARIKEWLFSQTHPGSTTVHELVSGETRASTSVVIGVSRTHPCNRTYGSKHVRRHSHTPTPRPPTHRPSKVREPVRLPLPSYRPPCHVSVTVVPVPSHVHVYVRPPLPPPFKVGGCVSVVDSSHPPPAPVHTHPFHRTPYHTTPLPYPPDHTRVPPVRRPREAVSTCQTVTSLILHPEILSGVDP